MINQKYSFNGYDPKHPIVIQKKAALKQLFDSRILNIKEYGAKCRELKQGWKNKLLVGVSAEELNNTTIIGTCFAQKEPRTNVFPVGMTGVVFQDCHLGNCNIPLGNTVIGGIHEHYAPQKDGEYWVVDKDLKPISPLSPERFDNYSLSKDVKSIPIEDTPIIKNAKEKVSEDERREKIITLTSDPAKLDEWIKKGGAI